MRRATRHAGRTLTAAILLAAAPCAFAQNPSLEVQVKAAYLSKLAPFVEWPPEAFAAPSSPFVLCVVGRDPFGAALDKAVAGQKVEAHPIEVRRQAKVEAKSGCNIVYVSQIRDQTASAALRALEEEAVLTVTDQASDDGSRGMVDFVVRENRVRFQIDARAASKSGVKISAKLLSLAVSVKQ